jgi:hypothetical protein
MAERITPERSLDLQTTRKPSDWSDVEYLKTPTKLQRAYLLKLSLLPSADDHRPLSDLVVGEPRIRLPQRFVVKNKGAYYYVNTEGYQYCRYVLRVPAEIFGEAEPAPKEPEPEVLAEDKTTGWKLTAPATPEKDLTTVVLAAGLLTGWLKLNDYPANTKHLAKALEDAINDLR